MILIYNNHYSYVKCFFINKWSHFFVGNFTLVLIMHQIKNSKYMYTKT